MRKQILSLLKFLALFVLARYAAVAVCVCLFPELRKLSVLDLLCFPAASAAILLWFCGVSMNGFHNHNPSAWILPIDFLVVIVSVCILISRVKGGWFWGPFVFFCVCVCMDVWAVSLMIIFGAALGALGAD